MVREGIVLGHLISERGIEVDKAKLEVIERLAPPVNVKGFAVFWDMRGSIVVLSKISLMLLDPSPICLQKMHPLNSLMNA